MCVQLLAFVGWICVAAAHAEHNQVPIAGPYKSLWYNTLPGDGGTQAKHHSFESAAGLY